VKAISVYSGLIDKLCWREWCRLLACQNTWATVLYCPLKSIYVGEHQTNDSAIFFIQHSSENAVLHAEKCSTACYMHEILNQNELFVDQKCFKQIKALPRWCNMKKNSMFDLLRIIKICKKCWSCLRTNINMLQ